MANQLPIRGILSSTDAATEQNDHPPGSIADVPTGPLGLMNLSQNFQILPVPTDDDDLETTARKMEHLAEVVKQGNSLALWTGRILAPETPRDPESMAMEQMTPQERMQYEAWKRMRAGASATTSSSSTSDTGADYGNNALVNSDSGSGQSTPSHNLLSFDWDTNVAPVPQGHQSLKKFTQRAAAMDIVFGHQGATPEHASWLTFNMLMVLPLIKAVTKVANIEKHFENHGNPHMQSLSNMEAVELKTARRLVAAAERNRSRELERIRRLTKSIAESASIIKSRAQGLEE